MTIASHFCPYTATRCTIEAVFDVQPLPFQVVEAIVGALEATVVEALEAAAGRTYRGQRCTTCGAWFPA